MESPPTLQILAYMIASLFLRIEGFLQLHPLSSHTLSLSLSLSRDLIPHCFSDRNILLYSFEFTDKEKKSKYTPYLSYKEQLPPL